MRSVPSARVAALVLLPLVALTACGGDSSSPQTTLTPLGPTNFATQPPVEETTSTSSPVDGTPLPSEQLYTIQSGDYLAKIAQQFGITIDEIVAYNEWPDGVNHVLMPGQDIKIPAGAAPQGSSGSTTVTAVPTETTAAPVEGATYEVQSGDYLAGIASKFDTTVDAIVAANGWSDGADHVIMPGDTIALPG